MEREVQLLQHGEFGVWICYVNPLTIKFKTFNPNCWDCSWLFSISLTAQQSNFSHRVQPSWQVHLPAICKWHVGHARRLTAGQAWESARAELAQRPCYNETGQLGRPNEPVLAQLALPSAVSPMPTMGVRAWPPPSKQCTTPSNSVPWWSHKRKTMWPLAWYKSCAVLLKTKDFIFISAFSSFMT